MAFNKRLWKGRQGTGLNKFSINGATPVTVINQPDSVTEQGDALSAGNLNDLEDRIYDAFDDIADGTQIVGKATADASGNVITTTYATKADLQDGTLVVKEAEIASKDEDGNNIKATYETKADASDLKSAIDNNSQRIENLEVAVSGSLVQTNVLTDPPSMANVRTITNANSILPWAILKRVGARAVAWIQQVVNGDFSENSGWFGTRGTITIDTTNHECSYTVTEVGDWTLTNRIDRSNAPLFTVGHKMLVLVSFYSSHATDVYFGCNTSTSYKIGRSNANSWSPLANIITVPSGYTNDRILFGFNATDDGYSLNDIAKFKDLKIHDLTAMNEYDSNLTDAQNIADFKAKFPASYYPYNAGEIIPLNPSAFKVVGKNKADVSDATSASNVVSTIGDDGLITFKKVTSATWSNGPIGYIDLEANTSYTLNIDNLPYGRFGLSSRDSTYPDVTPIQLSSGNSGLSPTNKSRVFVSAIKQRAYIWYCTDTQTSDAQVFSAYFQCEIGSTATAYEEYKETTIDTSFTSDYKYVNENCHDYSENVLVNGVMRREEHKGIVGEVDLGTQNWTKHNGTSSKPAFFYILISDIKNYTVADVANVVVAGFATMRYADITLSTTNFIESHDRYIQMVAPEYANMTADEFKSAMSGHYCYYERANPSNPTLHDPIPNIPCEDGTTVQAVTPQTDLVNAIDVPSTIAYMTKISS